MTTALLTVHQAALHVGLSASTLNKMRMTGAGPKYVRLGKRRVAYPLNLLNAWLEANTHSATTEYLDKKTA
jgi:predicted DNA-binding transcriptional regulator AlpA